MTDRFDIGALSATKFESSERVRRKWLRYSAWCRLPGRTDVDAIVVEPGLGQLGTWNDEFIFAWFWARSAEEFIEAYKLYLACTIHKDDCLESMQLGSACVGVQRRGAVAAMNGFLFGGTPLRRFACVFESGRHAEGEAPRPLWRLEYVEGMEPRGAGILRDFYCSRSVTVRQMAEEIGAFRAEFGGNEVSAGKMVFLDHAPPRTWWRIDRGSVREWTEPLSAFIVDKGMPALDANKALPFPSSMRRDGQ